MSGKTADTRGVEAALAGLRAPQEAAAAERGVEIVRAAVHGRAPLRRHPRRRLRVAIATGLAAATAAVVLSPAGASVRDWIEEAVTVERKAPAPTRLPTAGSILTVGNGGAWIAREDGSRRLLGRYHAAGFSPRGVNVVVAGRELAALDAGGQLRWSLTPERTPRDPSWSPTGLRIAYRSGGQLRIVEGDGSPDRLHARGVAAVGAAWRPLIAAEPQRDVLAWAAAGGVSVADVAADPEPLKLQPRGRIRELSWLAGGRLVVATDRELAIYSIRGRLVRRLPGPAGSQITDLSAAPDGKRVAVARRYPADGRSELALIRVEPGVERERRLFSGPDRIAGVAFAPDGSWIGFGWPAADSWLFARTQQETKLIEGIEAISGITEIFSGGAAPPGGAFPRIEAWCC